jgi:hypothetical protein
MLTSITLREAFCSPLLVIRQIEEAAKRVQDARDNNLALCIIPEKVGKLAILYRAEINHRAPEEFSLIRVYGMIVVGKLTNSTKHAQAERAGLDLKQIFKSAAEGGFGPLMYDIGLAAAYPSWVCADREGISKAAQRVWDYYLKNRPDVERVYLPEAMKPGFYQDQKMLKALILQTSPSSKEMVSAFKRCRYSSVENANDPTMVLPNKLDNIPKEHSEAYSQWKKSEAIGSQEFARLSPKAQLDLLKKLFWVREEVDRTLRDISVAWAFRQRGPSSAKEGPALATLLQRHEENIKEFVEIMQSDDDYLDNDYQGPQSIEDLRKRWEYLVKKQSDKLFNMLYGY